MSRILEAQSWQAVSILQPCLDGSAGRLEGIQIRALKRASRGLVVTKNGRAFPLFGIVLALFWLWSGASHAGTWSQVDEKTIKLNGPILRDEMDRFAAAIGTSVDTLVVDSQGGETMAAIAIGREIFRKQMTVIVENRCLSSCANYLFTAAKRKIIRHAVVGYHGNMKACFGTDEALKDSGRDLEAKGLSEQAINESMRRFEGKLAVEADFLRSIGVLQELFDRSCRIDKGMSDGREYSFLLPSGKTFLRYGIDHIEGEQDPETVRSRPDYAFD